jgi:hypothetical protein
MMDSRTIKELNPCEVTPEMIEAGMEVVWRTPIMEPDEAELKLMTEQIYREMFRASQKYQHIERRHDP